MRLGGLVSAIRRSVTKERDHEPASHQDRNGVAGLSSRRPRADGDDAKRSFCRRGEGPQGRRPSDPLGAPRLLREAAATPWAERGRMKGARSKEWSRRGSNPWPPPCHGGALPAELRPLVRRAV